MKRAFHALDTYVCALSLGIVLLWAFRADAQFGVARRIGGSQCIPIYSAIQDYQNDIEEGFFYDDGASGTGYAHCPTGEHASSTIETLSADIKYKDTSTTRCMSCIWYVATHNGSKYYSTYRYSDGATGSSCVASYTGYGTMAWSSFSFGSVSNVAQVNAYCLLPRAGGIQYISSYRVTTNVGF